MGSLPIVDRVPLIVIFLIAVAVVLVAVTIGFRAGMRVRRRAVGDAGSSIGSIVGAMLGLLAFMLAFTFGGAASRFDQRKQIVLDEVNAIGTAALRADFLSETHRAECRALLIEYIEVRLEAVRDLRTLPRAIARSEDIQRRLWDHAVAAAADDPGSRLVPLFGQALNEVFDLHTARVTVGTQYRVPAILWFGLTCITALTMGAVGYQFGLSGRGEFPIRLALALAFACVVYIIADLDRPGHGTLRVSQQPMVTLLNQLNATTQTTAPSP